MRFFLVVLLAASVGCGRNTDENAESIPGDEGTETQGEGDESNWWNVDAGADAITFDVDSGEDDKEVDGDCYDACIEKGTDVATCEAYCGGKGEGGKDEGKESGGEIDEDCYGACIDKGASPAECEAACGDGGKGEPISGSGSLSWGGEIDLATGEGNFFHLAEGADGNISCHLIFATTVTETDACTDCTFAQELLLGAVEIIATDESEICQGQVDAVGTTEEYGHGEPDMLYTWKDGVWSFVEGGVSEVNESSWTFSISIPY